MKKNKIFLIGYYGFNNAGDELLLAKSQAFIQETLPKAKIFILNVKRRTSHVERINRWSPYQVFKTIWQSDWIIFGGGGLFQDKTSALSFLYYLGILILAILCRKKIFFLSQGVGPIQRKIFLKLFQYLLKYITCISVRDIHSYQFLSDLGYQKNLYLSADLAYFKEKIIEPTNPKKNIIGISYRKTLLPKENLKLLKLFFETISKNDQHPKLFLEMQSPGDHQAYFDLIQTSAMEYCTPTHGAWDRFDEHPLSMIIGMRFHALVYASLRAIPFLALIYDEKVKSLSEDLAQESIDLRQPHLTLEKCMEKYQKIIQNRSHYQNLLIQRVPKLIRKNDTLVSFFRLYL